MEREVVMSEDRRRKLAVWMRAGRGVVARWVVRKAASEVGVGVRDLVVVNWADIWEDGLDIVWGSMESLNDRLTCLYDIK